MRILKVIHGYPPNYNAGSEVYSKTVCEEFAKMGHSVSVFTREENLYEKDFSIRKDIVHDNLVIYTINNPQGKDGYAYKKMDEAFGRLLETQRPDIAYIGHLNHLSIGIVDELFRRRIPIVFMLHDFWLMCPRGQFLMRSIGRDDDFALCDRQIDRNCACNCYEVYFSGNDSDRECDIDHWSTWIHRRMDCVRSLVEKVNLFIAPSKYLMGRFVNEFGIAQDKIRYLDYGFPQDYLTVLDKTKSNGTYTFGYIGTHIAAKGVNLLIKAFLGVTGNCALRIYGRDNGQSTAALKKMAQGAINKIDFCGEYQNDHIVQDVFEKVDCIVVPSIWGENSPLVIHEAQECHIPVITAGYGGMGEYVHHKINGLLFKHRDAQSLKEQMQWALNNRDQMALYGSRGYLYTNDGHTISVAQHCQDLIRIFNNVIQK